MEAIKKYYKVVLVFLFFIVAGIILFFLAKNVKQENMLRNELKKIYALDWNTETIDMNIKAKGDYGRIEKISKEYYNDLYTYRKKYDTINFRNSVSEILSAKKIGTKNFKKSREDLDTKFKDSTETTDRIIEMVSNDYISSLISKEDFSKKYVRLYNDLMLSENEDKIVAGWVELRDNNEKIYKLACEALDILKNNQSAWYVVSGTLYFSDDNMLKKYNNVIDQIQNIHSQK